MQMINYLLLLGIGHFLGDFYFRNEKDDSHKSSDAKSRNTGYAEVILHSLKYAAAMILTIIPVWSADMFLAAVYVFLAHFAIDTIKYLVVAKRKIRESGRIFIADQFMHMFSIFAIAYILYTWHFTIGHREFISDILKAFGYAPVQVGRWILACLVIHVPVNTLIQRVLGPYKRKEKDGVIRSDNRAGRKIGTIERLIMLIFLALNQYAALGLVLTAKSIARYDKIAKDEQFAEYYLLGTLLSTLCVVLCKVIILG